jgi:hypothetical protein
MKAYYENIEFWDLLSLPFYFLLAYFLLYFLAKSILLPDKNYLKLHFLAVLLFYLIIGLIDFQFKLIPYFPDTALFTRILETGITPDNQSIGVKIGYKYLAIPIHIISLKSIFNYFLFNILFFQAGLIFIAGSFKQLHPTEEVWGQRIFLILMTFMPTIIIYSFTPLRESYFALALGLFFYGLTKPRLLNVFLILGFVLAAMLRIQLVLYFFIVILTMYFFEMRWKSSTKIVISILIVPLGFLALNLISEYLLKIKISPESLSLFRNIQRVNYFESGVTYPEVEWNSWFDLALAFPGLFFQFLLAPFPVLIFIPFWTKLAYFADGLFLLFVLFLFFISLKEVKKYYLWITFIVIYLAMSSFFEFHMLGAVRHRFPATILLTVLVSRGLVHYLPTLKWFFKY